MGARHLVAGRVERKGANFEVQFRLFEGAPGRLLATETNQCEAADCSVAELTRQTVRELARQMLNGTVPGVSIPGTAALTPQTPGGPTDSAATPVVPLESPPAALVQSAAVQDSGPSTARQFLPYAAIAAGVGTLGVGGWLIWRDGNCAEEKLAIANDCNTWRETMWEGVAVTGVGAALLATGRGRRHHRPPGRPQPHGGADRPAQPAARGQVLSPAAADLLARAGRVAGGATHGLDGLAAALPGLAVVRVLLRI